MKAKDARKAFVDKARAEWAERSLGEHMTIVQSRPGTSQKEVQRLKEYLQIEGITKKTKMGEIEKILHPEKKEAGKATATVLSSLAILGILTLVVMIVLYQIAGRPAGDSAFKSAKEFAKFIDSKATVQCMKYDSDGDGYVSCTVFRPEKLPVGIECAIRFSFNNGCRMAKSQVVSGE